MAADQTMVRILLTDHDIYLFKEGSHFRLHRKLGFHPAVLEDGRAGTFFPSGPRTRSGFR